MTKCPSHDEETHYMDRKNEITRMALISIYSNILGICKCSIPRHSRNYPLHAIVLSAHDVPEGIDLIPLAIISFTCMIFCNELASIILIIAFFVIISR